MRNRTTLALFAVLVGACGTAWFAVAKLADQNAQQDAVREVVLRRILVNERIAYVGIQVVPDREGITEWIYNRLHPVRRDPQFPDPGPGFVDRFRDLAVDLKPASQSWIQGANFIEPKDGRAVLAVFVGYPRRISASEYHISVNTHRPRGHSPSGTFRVVLVNGRWVIRELLNGWNA